MVIPAQHATGHLAHQHPDRVLDRDGVQGGVVGVQHDDARHGPLLPLGLNRTLLERVKRAAVICRSVHLLLTNVERVFDYR
jgi:hypothetical protein